LLNFFLFLLLSLLSSLSFACEEAEPVIEREIIVHNSHPVNITIPEESIKVELIPAKNITEKKQGNNFALFALLFSIFTFFFTLYRTSKKEKKDKTDAHDKSQRDEEISRHDQYWFRDVVSPKIMDSSITDIKRFVDEYTSIITIADDEIRFERADTLMEDFDIAISKIEERLIFLRVLPNGESTEQEIKNIFQRLRETFITNLFGDDLALTPDQPIVEPYESPFTDAASELLVLLKGVQEGLY
jgi:hypothetical protein